jgi:hypothetical protein
VLVNNDYISAETRAEIRAELAGLDRELDQYTADARHDPEWARAYAAAERRSGRWWRRAARRLSLRRAPRV